MTAASDDNYEKGVERQAIEAMGFKVYKNSSLKDHKPPIIHQEIDLSDIRKVFEVIRMQRENQGVLVYANGQVFEELKQVEDFEVVTQETSD